MQQYEYTFLAELSDYFWDSVDRVQCTQENTGLTKRLPYLILGSQKDSLIYKNLQSTEEISWTLETILLQNLTGGLCIILKYLQARKPL